MYHQPKYRKGHKPMLKDGKSNCQLNSVAVASLNSKNLSFLIGKMQELNLH